MKFQDQADLIIAQGALTNSKRPSTFIEGVYPTHLVKGSGCYVWDTNGNKYFDFICGLGCNILGYAQEDINKAIIMQLSQGATLSLSTPHELQLGYTIKSIFPFIERMKFLKTGTEACAAAVRIARAATNKDIILSEGYHGWSDGFVSLTDPSIGVPKRPPNTFQKLVDGDWDDNVAGVIIEPVMTDFSPARIDWLKALREKCTKLGVILIFDEVITGFRFQKLSVANYLDIQPDIICLGKAIANGLPLAVVGGSKKIMNCGEYFVSSTFAGETLSLVAAQKTIELLRSSHKIENLWLKGEAWLNEFNSYWPEGIRIEGYATRGRFEGIPLVKALFFQEAIGAGMLFGPSWFFNFHLAEKSKVTLDGCKDIICKIKSGTIKLKGKMPQSPFAEKIRQKI